MRQPRKPLDCVVAAGRLSVQGRWSARRDRPALASGLAAGVAHAEPQKNRGKSNDYEPNEAICVRDYFSKPFARPNDAELEFQSSRPYRAEKIRINWPDTIRTCDLCLRRAAVRSADDLLVTRGGLSQVAKRNALQRRCEIDPLSGTSGTSVRRLSPELAAG
jgi:hypothetical protein